MDAEEHEILPVAQEVLTDEDWALVDQAFRDELRGYVYDVGSDVRLERVPERVRTMLALFEVSEGEWTSPVEVVAAATAARGAAIRGLRSS